MISNSGKPVEDLLAQLGFASIGVIRGHLSGFFPARDESPDVVSYSFGGERGGER
jgi:hypothetical protein